MTADSFASLPSEMSKPSMSAVAKVFTTVELLELILLKLPMQDLLRARQVRDHWRQVIVSSAAIQKALFLRPGTAAEAAVDARCIECINSDGTSGKIAVHPWICEYECGRIWNYDVRSGFSTSRTAIDWGVSSSEFALMSITQPPMKLEMIVTYEAGVECCEDKYTDTHSNHVVTSSTTKVLHVFRLVQSTVEEHAGISKGLDSKRVVSPVLIRIDVLKVKGATKK
ncbi:hypothetical protein KC320_g2318 [Hortaea werneckii]|nr:hypothetical protein KC320_g2318 [Hortaea werneckii]